MLGTPAYMAPEQAAGKARQVSVATDVYGLGAILYYLLAGRPPFAADSAPQTLRLVTDAEPVPPRSLRPQASPDLQTICLKCLEKDPARRYPSAGALGDDLRRWLAGEPIPARPATRPERLAKWARRRPSVAALIAVSVVSALVLIGVLSASYVRMRVALGRETAAMREKREQLVQGYLARGNEATEGGDDGAALLWFVAALREETDPGSQSVIRTRIGLGLRRVPRLRNLLTSGAALTFTADGKDLVSIPPTSAQSSGAYQQVEGGNWCGSIWTRGGRLKPRTSPRGPRGRRRARGGAGAAPAR